MSKPEASPGSNQGKPRLLILDPDEGARSRLRWAFCRDFDVLEASSKAEALRLAGQRDIPVGIIGLGRPPSPLEPPEGISAIKCLMAINPIFKAIAATKPHERAIADKALQSGAFDYLTKPAIIEDARLTVRRAFHAYGMHSEDLSECQGLGWPCDMIGLIPEMQSVFSTIRRFAEISVPALISGERGTGRETAARAVHRLGSRHAMPFITVECAGTPEYILEKELFGKEAPGGGRKKGKIELSDGGILFLRNVQEIGSAAQIKLLRFLQEHSFESSERDGKANIDTKIISSAGTDLKELVREGVFVEELYHRLCVKTLHLPPLRERREDIYILALFFLKKYAMEYNRPVSRFEKDAVDAMISFQWPGNLQELESRVRRAVAICRRKSLSAEDLSLPPSIKTQNRQGHADAGEAFRKKMIDETLSKHGWNISRTALELGISRQYLSKLIVKYALKR